MRQRDSSNAVYEFICGFIRENGYSPSFREIAAACRKSLSTVQYHLEELRSIGKIDYKDGICRSITVNRDA